MAAAALINAALAVVIWRRSIGYDSTRFFVWGLGLSGIRTLLFFALIIAVWLRGRSAFPAFALAAGIGYVVLLGGEALYLVCHSATLVRPVER